MMRQVAVGIDSKTLKTLAAAEYAMDAYFEASESYARFRLSGKRRDLKAAARTLCAALERLQEDSRFYAALEATVENIEDAELDDFDDFLDEHFEILTKLGLAPAGVERLLDDVRYAVCRVRKGDGNWRDIEQLKRRIESLAKATCEAARNAGGFRRQARISAGIVRDALPVVGCVALAVGDVIAAVHGAHHAGKSIHVGLFGALDDAAPR